MLDAILLAEFIDHVQELLVPSNLPLAYVYCLNVLFELDWSMDLNFLVGCSAPRRNLFRLRSIERGSQFVVIHLAQNLETVLESRNRRVSTT